MSKENSARKFVGTEDHHEVNEPIYNRRILVVEDEKEIANSYANILAPIQNAEATPIRRSSRSSRAGTPSVNAVVTNKNMLKTDFEVSVANDAETALEIVKEALSEGKPFAMGFFDVMLGKGMDGISLVKQIHQMDPKMHAVFVTAYQDRNVDAISEVIGDEMSDRWDYLNKPFSEGEIIQTARNNVSAWNLKREKIAQDETLAEANKMLLDSERLSSIAAVAKGVGHEFGNILLQISGNAELNINGTEEEMKGALENVLKASEIAGNILTRFKNLASANVAQAELSRLMIREPLDEALLLMSYQLRSQHIKVCRIKNDNATILGNRTSLVQVFVNLIINAMYVMEGGGQIDFSVTNDGKWVNISIHDFGPGIPGENLKNVLEPFFTTKGDKGSGLGLAICREIIEAEHGGEFSIGNHYTGKGAEIKIRLPIKNEDGGNS